MIDTVVINLYNNQFRLLPEYYGRFSPDVANFFNPPFVRFGSRGSVKADCNPTLADKGTGLYFPRLTMFRAIRKGGYKTFLRIEFSAPKIIFGNNFDELCENDFNAVCGATALRLKHFGVITDAETVAGADISTIHYSKNIALTDYSKPSQIIKEVSRADVNGLIDVNHSDFQNTGQAFKVHTNRFEFIIYDKIKDLKQTKKSEKRSIDKGNESQLPLFEALDFQKPFEVIRLEARYGNKPEIKKLFKALDVPIESTITFHSLFSKKMSKGALKHELAKIKVKYPVVMNYQSNKMMSVYSDLVINNPDSNLKDIFSAMGYRTLLEESGTRELKNLAGKTPAKWYKFRKMIDSLNFTHNEKNCFSVLDEGLEKFEPLELKNYL